MHDHILVNRVGLGRGLIAAREIGKGIGSLEFGAGLRSAFARAPMTRDAAVLIKNFAISWVRRLRVPERLREQSRTTCTNQHGDEQQGRSREDPNSERATISTM